ncbi:MAG: hypothetical protein MJ161_01235 [Clostridia bacterium]|nr:hypothetical protein [Clostridia bacterium]
MNKKVATRITAIIIIMAMVLSGADICSAASTYPVKAGIVKANGSRFDVRIAAKEKTWGYDTIQGACSHNGYAYMSLYNRQKERIKIVKVNLATMKVVKKSKVIGCTCHANSLTYNERNNTIIICRGKGGRKSIAIVNASSLKLKKTKTIKISRKMAGGTYYGIAAIAYNSEKNIYVAKLRGDSNKIVLLNSSFKPKKRVKITGNRSYLMPQGLYTEGSFMYDVQSFKGKHKYNLVTVRNVNTGKLLGRMKIASGKTGQLYELENIFHEGNQWYICFYRAKVLKRGDIHRKNYLCRINVPKKLQPPIPQPATEPVSTDSDIEKPAEELPDDQTQENEIESISTEEHPTEEQTIVEDSSENENENIPQVPQEINE